jgi:hypothetical protein
MVQRTGQRKGLVELTETSPSLTSADNPSRGRAELITKLTK